MSFIAYIHMPKVVTKLTKHPFVPDFCTAPNLREA